LIFKKEIFAKAEEWLVPANTVDKDYVLGHFLNSFYSFEKHRQIFVFKGGTCLRKCYFPNYRFSEDLDFTLLDKSFLIDKSFLEQIAIRCEVVTGIRFWVRDVEKKRFRNEEKGYKCVIHFWGANHSRNEMPPPKERWQTKIEIDISFDEEILSPLNHTKIIHLYSDQDKISALEIPVYALTEILLEKVRAFYQRSYKAPRDFYDVWYLLKNASFENWKNISMMLQRKCAFKNKVIDATIFKDEDVLKSVSRSWNNSIAHHLPKQHLPELSEVCDYLDKHLFVTFFQLEDKL
jgi:predicted nucleotidyltransferase component of viral defense system